MFLGMAPNSLNRTKFTCTIQEIKLHVQEQKQHKAPRMFLKKTKGGQKINIKNTLFHVEEEKSMIVSTVITTSSKKKSKTNKSDYKTPRKLGVRPKSK